MSTIHLTGSDKTFEAIVFGSGEDGARRKALRTPRLTKPITAELGGVNPVIIVPGPWTAAELRRQALQLATWQVVNTAFACLTPRILIQHRQWSQRHALLQAIHQAFAGAVTRPAYYPGARERYAAFLAAHPNALQAGAHDAERLPWTIIPDIDPTQTDALAFTSEAFCSLYTETALDAPTTADYIRRAVTFANETLWGNLCAMILVHPRSLVEPGVAAALDEALLTLRYGTICINMFSALAYALMAAPWGAFPGNDLFDIQSGVGWVNNVQLFAQPEKVIFRAPFMRIDPTLLTFPHLAAFGRQFADFSAAPSPWKLLGLLATALR